MFPALIDNPNNFLLDESNCSKSTVNTRNKCGICSNLTIKARKRRH